MEKRELVERLVPLIPPPRANQVRHHGILAPAAGLRDRITPSASDEAVPITPKEDGGAAEHGDEPNDRDTERTRPYRVRWAKLLMRVFEIAGHQRWPSACESVPACPQGADRPAAAPPATERYYRPEGSLAVSQSLSEIAKRIEAKPWNGSGVDKTWVMNAMSTYLKFRDEVHKAKRVRSR